MMKITLEDKNQTITMDDVLELQAYFNEKFISMFKVLINKDWSVVEFIEDEV